MMFSKKNDETELTTDAAPAGKPSKHDKASGNDNAMSVIAQGMRIVGDVECVGVLKIEGIIEGSVRGARQVLLGRQGEVRGDLQAREVVVGGKVDGTVVGLERVEIQGTAIVSGDVHTKSIVVLEGGRINGALRMDDAPGAGVKAGAVSIGVSRTPSLAAS